MKLFDKKKSGELPAAEQTEGVAAPELDRDEELFRNLSDSKKKKKRKKTRTTLIILAVAAALATFGIIRARSRVREKFTSDDERLTSYAATVGSINTTVSGSGSISNVDEKTLKLPAGVKIVEMKVSAYDKVTEGDVIATVDLDTVMTSMSDLQTALEKLDKDIAKSASDKVSGTVSAGVGGRVKMLYAAVGDDVTNVMYEHGALAVISLDGFMSVEIESSGVSEGDRVAVLREDGKTENGVVESAGADKAVITVRDDVIAVGEHLTVTDTEGKTLGEGEAYVHNPLNVTAITGTISRVNTRLNSKVSATSSIFTLTDTSYSGKYDSLLRDRSEKEETLLDLVRLYRDGALTAPFSGSVSSIKYDKDKWDKTKETEVIALSPDVSMDVTISIDESDILSLELGQTAEVTVDSVSSDYILGTVTEINRTVAASSTASSSSGGSAIAGMTSSASTGVTKYTAVVTVEKQPGMLAGMTASVVIRIQGVDDAVIIPAEALHQTSSTSYVYTSYDRETKEFGGLVEVVPGISNSSYVEITEGLHEGDVVWYIKEQKWSFADMMSGRNRRDRDDNQPKGERPPEGGRSGGEESRG